MDILPQILFLLLLIVAFGFFGWRMNQIRLNIFKGRDVEMQGNKSERWRNVFLMALGQKRMFHKPLVAFFHIILLIGFVVINIKLIEIIIDGLTGTHRLFLPMLGPAAYSGFISVFEGMALLVIISCLVFLSRRVVVGVHRLVSKEMKPWSKFDANLMLIAVGLLMVFFLNMNATDVALQNAGHPDYHNTGNFLVSSHIAAIYSGLSEGALLNAERFFWWLHIITILGILNLIPYSKHLHIMLAFPNTYFMKLDPDGKMTNMPEVQKEVKAMMSGEESGGDDDVPDTFGAKDVEDLNWKHLLDAYACTQCGRCTEACPANMTGKLLSPRKVMIDTRERMEEKAAFEKKNGPDADDNKNLLRDYISEEELWACTSCNACVEACPVGIDPLSIILEMRRNLVMEEANAPSAINQMFNNLENNGAPWQFSPEDRTKWINE